MDLRARTDSTVSRESPDETEMTENVDQLEKRDQRDLPDVTESPVLMVLLDQMVNLDSQDLLVPPGLPDVDAPDPRGKKDLAEMTVSPEPPVKMDAPEETARMDVPVNPESPDSQEQTENQESLEKKVSLDGPERAARRSKENVATPVNRVRKEMPDFPDPTESPEMTGKMARKVPMENREHVVLRGQLDQPVLLVKRETVANTVKMVPRVQRGLRVRKVSPVTMDVPVIPDRRVLRVFLELMVTMEKPVFLVPAVPPETPELLVPMVSVVTEEKREPPVPMETME